MALLNEWAVGFYTELDFCNEAQNQMRLLGPQGTTLPCPPCGRF